MEWHTGEGHVRAQQHMGSAKPAPPSHQEAQWSSDTCDDDLGDIQNGAERCRFTVASFILGVCCENTHIHTHIQLRTQRTCRLRQTGGSQLDWKCEPHTCRAYSVRARAACTPSIPDTVEWYCVDCQQPLHYFSQHRQQQAFSPNAVWTKSSTRQSKDRGCWCSNYRNSIH